MRAHLFGCFRAKKVVNWHYPGFVDITKHTDVSANAVPELLQVKTKLRWDADYLYIAAELYDLPGHVYVSSSSSSSLFFALFSALFLALFLALLLALFLAPSLAPSLPSSLPRSPLHTSLHALPYLYSTCNADGAVQFIVGYHTRNTILFLPGMNLTLTALSQGTSRAAIV